MMAYSSRIVPPLLTAVAAMALAITTLYWFGGLSFHDPGDPPGMVETHQERAR
jgi:hypothetical protein